MDKLDAKTQPVGTLFSQDYFFRVPEYQRPFSWDTNNFEDLIDDVIDANKDQEYFLGTIVLHHRKKEGHFDIVDGQQRLTSIMILLACLRDIVEDEGYKNGTQDKILQKKNVVDGIPEKIRLEVKDRNFFNKLVVDPKGTLQTLNEKSLPEPEWRYVNAVSVFRSKLTSLKQEEIQKIIGFINQKCILIFLATSNFEDAFRLFTIVNDRGKQLRRIDILKAINIAPDIITKDSVRNRLAQQWEEVEKDLGESTFENIFHLVRLIILKDKPQGDLLKEFEQRIFSKKYLIQGEPFFDVIFDYTKLYTSIFLDRDIVPEDAKHSNQYKALIHIMNAHFSASEWRACLLFFAQRFNQENIYEFTLKLEKVYLAQWVKGVRKDERYSDYSKILALIDSAKKSEDVLKGISPDTTGIQQATQRKDIYAAGFSKYFLLRLELVTSEHDVPKNFDAKSIEHVLPQNPEGTGYWSKSHDLSKISEYVNSIGNLVLLSQSKNSGASNYDFDKKKEKYLRSRVSDYPRSIQVLDYKDWDRATIDKRTKEAESLILQDP